MTDFKNYLGPGWIRADFAHLYHLPTAHYRIFGVGNALLYTGVTYDMRMRMSAHRCDSRWWPEMVRQETEWLPDRYDAELAEYLAILAEEPKYNDRRCQERLGRYARCAIADIQDEGCTDEQYAWLRDGIARYAASGASRAGLLEPIATRVRWEVEVQLPRIRAGAIEWERQRNLVKAARATARQRRNSAAAVQPEALR